MGGGGVVSSFCLYFFLHPVDPVTGARAPICVWVWASSSLSLPQLERTRAVHVTSHSTAQATGEGRGGVAWELSSCSLFMRHAYPRARLWELGVFLRNSTSMFLGLSVLRQYTSVKRMNDCFTSGVAILNKLCVCLWRCHLCGSAQNHRFKTLPISVWERLFSFWDYRVVQRGFSTFRLIHRKREGVVFSGERNVSARCLPAYNSCSSSRVSGTGRPGLSLAGPPPTGSRKSSLRPRRLSIGQGRIDSARSVFPVHATAAWGEFEKEKARGPSGGLQRRAANKKKSMACHRGEVTRIHKVNGGKWDILSVLLSYRPIHLAVSSTARLLL